MKDTPQNSRNDPAIRTARWLESSIQMKILSVSLFILFLGLAYDLCNFSGDSFFCLAAGDWVLEHGRFPVSDPFSYNSLPNRWILHFPLVQIGFSWLASSFGLESVYFLSIIISTTALCLFWFPYGISFEQRLISSIPICLMLFVDTDHFYIRGQLLGHLFFALFLIALLRLRRGERVSWWVTVILMALWVNSHPSFMLALVLPVAFACSAFLEPADSRPKLKPYLIFFIIALLSTGLTPYGYLLALDTLSLFSHRGHEVITLFKSPDFHDVGWILVLILGQGTAIIRLIYGRNRNRRSDIVLLFCFLFVTCYSRRYLIYLTVWEVVLLAESCRTDNNSLLRIPHKWLPERLRPHCMLALSLLLLIPSGYLFSRSPNPVKKFPIDAARKVEQLKLPNNILNCYRWGGYLIYRWKGRPKVFIDGRNNCFANSIIDDYLRFQYIERGWETLLNLYRVNTILWQVDTPFDRALKASPAWQEIYRDQQAVIYVRK